MTQFNTSAGTVMPKIALQTPADQPAIDIAVLIADLFSKLADAQCDLLCARAKGEERAAAEHLLRLRATALLIACLPADPNSDAFRFKVLAATVMREEDGSEASHAWLMIERALVLDQRRAQAD